MTNEEVLAFTRNHASEVRAILLYVDTTLNTWNEGYIIPCEHLAGLLEDSLDLSITKIDAIKNAIGDLE